MFSWIEARLKEPSTYAGLASLLGLVHIAEPSWLIPVMTIVGGAVAGVLAIVVPEKK
jgi:hypothetical protein